MKNLWDSLHKNEQELKKSAQATLDAMLKFAEHLQTYKDKLQIDKKFIQ